MTDIMSKNELDVLALLKKLWVRRKLIFRVSVIFFLLGMALAIFTPASYRANSKFIPQTSSSKPNSSLGGLASLAGIDIGSMGAENEISPVLYPKIVESISFRSELLATQVTWNGEVVSYETYISEKPKTVLSFIADYTIGLPGLIMESFKGDDSKGNIESSLADVNYLTTKQFELLEKVKDKISLEIDEDLGYIKLNVEEGDPLMAAELTKWAEQRLQQRVLEYKIKNTQALYDYTLEQFNSKQKELYAYQDSLADFTERNQLISSAYVENELRRLNAKYQMINSVYLELAKQKEQMALQLKKDTPVFSIIEPVTVPVEKSGPNRVLIIMVFTFMGIMFSVAFVLVLVPFKKVIATVIKAE